VWFWKDVFCSVIGQPPRADWSKAYRLRRIKQKMSNVADTAAGVFDLLDADGTSSLLSPYAIQLVGWQFIHKKVNEDS